MVIHAHAIQLSLTEGALPTEFRLFKLGKNDTSKGTFVLDDNGMKSILAAYAEHGVDLAIDYEHQTFESASNGKPAPAAGWFKPEPRADGLWAVNVRWTDAAAEMLRGKEYRYFSPTFEVDANKRITRLLPLALTNFPATKNLAPLVAAKHAPAVQASTEETRMPFSASIVGLKDDAPESDVESRIIALAQTEAAVFKATGKDNLADVVSDIIAAKDAVVKLAAAEAQLQEMMQVHASTEQAERDRQITLLVDSAAQTKHYGLPRDEFRKVLADHGKEYGVDALVKLIATYSNKVRAYQAPVVANSAEAQTRAIEEYRKANPGMSFADAYIKLAAERPALFSQEVR